MTLSLDNINTYTSIEDKQRNILRGDILDRNYRILAVSDELHSLYANPVNITNKQETASIISSKLGVSFESIFSKINNNKNFTWIERKLSNEDYKAINNLNLQGIDFSTEYHRFYPNESLASHVLGFCNIDNIGAEGIEKTFNSYLNGDILQNNSTDNNLRSYFQKGLHLQLTIDSNIQAIAESSLQNIVKKNNAETGSFILADGTTGEIISMANYPDFDPNRYGEYSQKNYRNTAIFSQYEPGSVFKIFTFASLLNGDYITKDTHFTCDGVFHKHGETVRCTGIHGSINMAGVFKYSCNDSTLQAAEYISDNEFYKFLINLGFGHKTGIELNGEQSGTLRNISDWSNRSMLAIPIGQEISVNALQVVQAGTSLINDGVMLKPFLVKRIFNENNKTIKQFKTQKIKKVFKSGISKQILYAMTSATDPGGSVSRLDINGISFSAKSGTAQIFDHSINSYSPTDVTGTLLLFFPTEKPKYIAYFTIFKPKGETQWGGVIGAEYINDFMSKVTAYLEIYPPNIEIDSSVIKQKFMYEKVDSLPVQTPDLSGLTAGDVISIFSNTSVDIKVIGKGKIHKQIPSPGEIIDNEDNLTIYLK